MVPKSKSFRWLFVYSAMNPPLTSLAFHRGVCDLQPPASNLVFDIKKGLPVCGLMYVFGMNETIREPCHSNWLILKQGISAI